MVEHDNEAQAQLAFFLEPKKQISWILKLKMVFGDTKVAFTKSYVGKLQSLGFARSNLHNLPEKLKLILWNRNKLNFN